MSVSNSSEQASIQARYYVEAYGKGYVDLLACLRGVNAVAREYKLSNDVADWLLANCARRAIELPPAKRTRGKNQRPRGMVGFVKHLVNDVARPSKRKTKNWAKEHEARVKSDGHKLLREYPQKLKQPADTLKDFREVFSYHRHYFCAYGITSALTIKNIFYSRR